MKQRKFFVVAPLLAALALAAPSAAQTVPNPFRVDLLAGGLSQPKGLDSARYQAGAGGMGEYLYVAESGANRVVEVDLKTGAVQPMASTLGTFPVGIGCYGGPFANYMYLGSAFSGGLERIDSNGVATPFALAGMPLAGLDFGKGQFGHDLYVGEWLAGNVWRVDTLGNATLFATVPGQSRYLEFSQGGAFGQFLYVTEYLSGDVYRIDPQGAVTLFASTGTAGVEGLALGPGGAFGTNLFVGNLITGQILEITATGSVGVWGSGFPGVADIRFVPGGKGGFTMALVDGVSSVFTVHK
jgi:DNA-binding beta-propeller fold protein YncE